MIVALDGPPDAELNENTRLLDSFETISNKVKKELHHAKGQLELRKDNIKDKVWYSSNERTEMDEEIKTHSALARRSCPISELCSKITKRRTKNNSRRMRSYKEQR